jgi:hypothetical protein
MCGSRNACVRSQARMACTGCVLSRLDVRGADWRQSGVAVASLRLVCADVLPAVRLKVDRREQTPHSPEHCCPESEWPSPRTAWSSDVNFGRLPSTQVAAPLTHMGIAGLLPQLRSITHRGHISRYRGQTGAVSCRPWSPRAPTRACFLQLCQTLGTPSHRHRDLQWLWMPTACCTAAPTHALVSWLRVKPQSGTCTTAWRASTC